MLVGKPTTFDLVAILVVTTVPIAVPFVAHPAPIEEQLAILRASKTSHQVAWDLHYSTREKLRLRTYLLLQKCHQVAYSAVTATIHYRDNLVLVIRVPIAEVAALGRRKSLH